MFLCVFLITYITVVIVMQGVVKQRDSERERLRKEVHRLREQCHERNSLHSHMEDNTSALDSIQSGDLESIEVSCKTHRQSLCFFNQPYFPPSLQESPTENES